MHAANLGRKEVGQPGSGAPADAKRGKEEEEGGGESRASHLELGEGVDVVLVEQLVDAHQTVHWHAAVKQTREGSKVAPYKKGGGGESC